MFSLANALTLIFTHTAIANFNLFNFFSVSESTI